MEILLAFSTAILLVAAPLTIVPGASKAATLVALDPVVFSSSDTGQTCTFAITPCSPNPVTAATKALQSSQHTSASSPSDLSKALGIPPRAQFDLEVGGVSAPMILAGSGIGEVVLRYEFHLGLAGPL